MVRIIQTMRIHKMGAGSAQSEGLFVHHIRKRVNTACYMDCDGSPRIIAEDLGFLTDDVRELLAKCEYPGMKVLEFAFDSRDGGDYRPHSYPTNCVAYTGTHDNETIKGWYASITAQERKLARDYLCDSCTPASRLHMSFIS